MSFPVFQKINLIMEDFRQDYVIMALTVVIFTITSVFGFLLRPKILRLFSRIWRKEAVKKNLPEDDCQNFIVDIKKVTGQLLQDWIKMRNFIDQIQNDQSIFVNRLESLFETKSKMLEQNISTALGEIFERNDQRYQEMKLTIETVQSDIQSIKAFLQAFQQSSNVQHGIINGGESKDVSPEQTDREIKNDTRVTEMTCSMQKTGECAEYDTSTLIITLKKCLSDLFKDAKLHLSVDREEENRELEVILSKLAEDRDDIKKTILEAFSIVSEQAKKNYDQFGQIGEGALKYIAVLNDNTNKLLKSKLDETDDVLKNTLRVVNRQTLDIDTVKKIIENMDGEFSELFEKLAQIYQINVEQYGEITLSLERTSNNWVQTVSKVEKLAKQICDDTNQVKQLFQEIKDLANEPPRIDAVTEMKKGKIKNSNAVESITIEDQQILTQKRENMIFVYSCWERMRSVSCNVEDGCQSVCKLICGLEQKLGSLSESIEKLDEFIRRLDLDILAEHAAPLNYNEDTAEIMNDIMQRSQGDAGDGHSRVITSSLRSKSLVHNIQNAQAINNAIKLTEIILRKVCEKNTSPDNEDPSQSKPDDDFDAAKESTPTVEGIQKYRDPMEPQNHKAEPNKTNQRKK